MNWKSGRTWIPWIGVALIVVAVSPGCSTDSGSGTAESSVADSTAFAQAMENEDAAARAAAFEKFIDQYPQSEYAGRAYYYLLDHLIESEPDRVASVLDEFQKTDFESPGWYNGVGWKLAEAGQHLDQAIAILEKAVAKARAAEDEDSDGLASCLDSEAWARYKAGDFTLAVERMEEALQLYGPGNDELDTHMAAIYDAAGEYEKALELYVSLLGHMESPSMRERMNEAISKTGQSIEEINAKIDGLRAAGAVEVPDFTLPSLTDGSPITLSDYRGKIVLLSFWHPT